MGGQEQEEGGSWKCWWGNPWWRAERRGRRHWGEEHVTERGGGAGKDPSPQLNASLVLPGPLSFTKSSSCIFPRV